MGFDMISDVSPASKHWHVCARVARMWDYCGTRDDQPPIHVDLVLVDEKGNAIYAEIPGSEATKFKKLIKEHGVYSFRKFLVAPSKSSYKPFPARYMLKFTPWTVACELKDVPSSFPMHVYHLVPFSDLPSRIGAQDYFVDVVGQIVGVSVLTYVRVSMSSFESAKRIITLRDERNTEMKVVLWGQRADQFEAELVHQMGQESAVVGVFVGVLVKSYNNEETLSGGAACRWYLNEDLPEVNSYFERFDDNFQKVEWVSTGAEKFTPARSRAELPLKTVGELRDIDPWETEATDFMCTVTIASLTPGQAWWFWSCSKCHRSASMYGSEYKCSAGCVSPKAYPKFRICLVGTDGTGSAEFVFFNRVAQQLVGKSVTTLLKSSGIPREIAAVVLQKYTLAVSVTQKSLTQRNISFQVNAIETFFGRQSCLPEDTRAASLTASSGSTETNLLLLPVPAIGPAIMPSPVGRLSSTNVPGRRSLNRVPIATFKEMKGESSKGNLVDPDAAKMLESADGSANLVSSELQTSVADLPKVAGVLDSSGAQMPPAIAVGAEEKDRKKRKASSADGGEFVHPGKQTDVSKKKK